MKTIQQITGATTKQWLQKTAAWLRGFFTFSEVRAIEQHKQKMKHETGIWWCL
ncbi:MAG: hypothetical protein U0T75_13075 [Chitinophagales bacterium]